VARTTPEVRLASELGRTFSDHETVRYLAKGRELRLLAAGIALLRAVAGMAADVSTRR
jgi:hypothetical protein